MEKKAANEVFFFHIFPTIRLQLSPMKLLHTSDWHLGRMLFTKRRYAEFEQFLDWLLDVITTERVDYLVVAGDIFDTTTPSNQAQELYFHFLGRLAESKSSCRHVVITAGNHDSPALIESPKSLLKSLNIHVVANVDSNEPEKEIFLFADSNGIPELVVCAVPYLQDRDVRKSLPGETFEDKHRKLLEGIAEHYRNVFVKAKEIRDQAAAKSGRHIPMIATGHLFATGSKISAEDLETGDGVRDLYVGNLSCVSAEIFPDYVDYVALGHLHVPQKIAATETIRYSGSPIPMGFGESRQEKIVNIVEFEKDEKSVSVESIPVPRFQNLRQIRGNWGEITHEIQKLKEHHENIWLEIEYTGQEVMPDLKSKVETEVSGCSLEVLRVQNRQVIDNIHLTREKAKGRDLHELGLDEVFRLKLDSESIPPSQQEELISVYHEVVGGMHIQQRQ